MLNYPNVSIPMAFDGVCEDCGKVIFRGTADSVSYFDSSVCKPCETEMFRYMEGFDRVESTAKQIAEKLLAF